LIQLVQDEHRATPQRNAVEGLQDQRPGLGGIHERHRDTALLSDDPDRQAEEVQAEGSAIREYPPGAKQSEEDLVHQVLYLRGPCPEATKRREQIIDLEVERLDAALRA
jgi:hypothetical protein